MEFEWDEEKRLENLRRRQVDFEVAAQIFAGPVIIGEDRRQDYGEKRYRAVGRFEGQAYVVAYTLRGEVCRIVTAWKIDAAGEKRYQALLSRRAAPQARTR
jgi:uncharacterized DUF497 family protein